MRLMSFAMTKDAFLAGRKTVTRRLGWQKLRAGDRLMAIEKALGLKRGERVVRLGEIEVLNVRREPLDAISPEDVAREGFEGMAPSDFVACFQEAMGCAAQALVTRIEFRRIGMLDWARRSVDQAIAEIDGWPCDSEARHHAKLLAHAVRKLRVELDAARAELARTVGVS